MGDKAKIVTKKKLPITLIVGVVIIVLAATVVFVVGFLPDIMAKDRFEDKIAEISEKTLTHVTLEDPDAASGIFNNAGYSTVISDERKGEIGELFCEAFGDVRFDDSTANSMISDHDYHLRFRFDDESKFDFYLKDGEVYTIDGNIRDYFSPKNAEAYAELTAYLAKIIEEDSKA